MQRYALAIVGGGGGWAVGWRAGGGTDARTARGRARGQPARRQEAVGDRERQMQSGKSAGVACLLFWRQPGCGAAFGAVSAGTCAGLFSKPRPCVPHPCGWPCVSVFQSGLLGSQYPAQAAGRAPCRRALRISRARHRPAGRGIPFDGGTWGTALGPPRPACAGRGGADPGAERLYACPQLLGAYGHAAAPGPGSGGSPRTARRARAQRGAHPGGRAAGTQREMPDGNAGGGPIYADGAVRDLCV